MEGNGEVSDDEQPSQDKSVDHDEFSDDEEHPQQDKPVHHKKFSDEHPPQDKPVDHKKFSGDEHRLPNEPVHHKELSNDESETGHRTKFSLKDLHGFHIVIALVILIIGITIGLFIRDHRAPVDAPTQTFLNVEKLVNAFLDQKLEPRITEKLRSLGDKIEGDLKEMIRTQDDRFKSLATELESAVKNVKDGASTMETGATKLEAVAGKLNPTVSSIEEADTKITATVSNLDSSRKELENIKMKFKDTSDATIQELKIMQKATTDTLNQIASDTSEHVNNGLQKHSENIKATATKFTEVTTRGSLAINSLSDMVGGDLRNGVTRIKTTGDLFDQLATGVSENVDKINDLVRYKCNITPAIAAGPHYSTWILIAFSIGLSFVFHYKMKDELKSLLAIPITQVPQHNMAELMPQAQQASVLAGRRPERDLKSIAPTGTPRYDVTVVTFTKETLEEAKQIFPQEVRGSWPQPGRVNYMALTGELDLTRVPPSRGYVVLIGSDARNSILEDMDGTMGSRKQETVVGLQATKRDVLVIYIDSDYQVDEPLEKSLYNSNLMRPTTHPVLKPLVKKDRFLSFRHWRITPLQAKHIGDWVRKLKDY